MLKFNLNVKYVEENVNLKSNILLNARQENTKNILDNNQIKFKFQSNTIPKNTIPKNTIQEYTIQEYTNYCSINKIYMFSTNNTIILARTLELYFNSLNIEVKIFDALTDNLINECISEPSLYLFFITLQAFSVNFENLPKHKYILYQTEDYNQNNITKLDTIVVENCYSIFDYSKINLQYYHENNIQRVKLLYPLIREPFFVVDTNLTLNIETNIVTATEKIDILFIGTLNERIEKILNSLKLYNDTHNLNYIIKIVDNLYDAISNLVKISKLVINLHYYSNSILEIFKIHYLLPYDCIILSEIPCNEQEMDLVEKYNKVVTFFPIINDDLTNIDTMFEIINNNINGNIDYYERKKFIDNNNEEGKILNKYSFISNIPLNIFQSWGTLDLPLNMKKNVDKLKLDNPEFKYYLYDDNMCRAFIMEYFDEEIVYTFDKLKPGAFKSDLWRLCILYIYGGIYLDIKFYCDTGFKLLYLTNKQYYVRDRTNCTPKIACIENNLYVSEQFTPKQGIYNALLVSFPKNALFLKLIYDIVQNVKLNLYNTSCIDVTGPHIFCNRFLDINKLELFLTDDGVSISNKNARILYIYDKYREEQNKYQITKHYGVLWYERDIYNYPTLSYIKSYKYETTQTIMINNNFVTLYRSNPSIIEYNNEILINFRWINYNYNEDGDKKTLPHQWISLNSRTLLNISFNIKNEINLQYNDLSNFNKYRAYGLEDIKIYLYNNEYYYIATLYDINRKTTSMSIEKYDYNENLYTLNTKIILPSFYNLENKIQEKNWAFVTLNTNLSIIHSWYPIKICKIVDNKLDLLEEKTDIPLFFNEARGSTNAVFYKNEIWFILHKAQSYIKNNITHYNYQHFFSIFDKNMNFIRHSELFKFENAKVEFCLSFLFKNDELYISYSLLDTICKISIYNIDFINNKLKWYYK